MDRINRTYGIALAVLIVALLGGCAGGAPRLAVGDTVDASLTELAGETWSAFLGAFPAQSACMGEVRVEASYTLTDRGRYDPAARTVSVRVPATPAMLQAALIHEWAHHLEHVCPGHATLRPAFIAAQNLPATTPWSSDAPMLTDTAVWAATPSEQYAEAAVEWVLGERSIPTAARVTDEAVRVVGAWGRGR